MKLKIETLDEKYNKGNYIGYGFGIIGLTLLSFIMGVNFILFIDYTYNLEMLRFTIGVIVINAFLFIKIE